MFGRATISLGIGPHSSLSLICLCNVFVGQSQSTGKGVRAFIKVMMMWAVVTVHCHLQITACGVSFSCYSS